MKIKRKFIIAMACIVSLVMCNVLDFANVNLKSYAVAAIFQITYNANGGVNPPEPQRDIIDGMVVLLKDKEGMTKPGFKFDGWTRDRHNTGKVYRPYEKFKMPRENVTFYAKWIPPSAPGTGGMSVIKYTKKHQTDTWQQDTWMATDGDDILYKIEIYNNGSKKLTDIEVDDKMLLGGSSEEVPEENYSGFDIDPTSTVSVGKVQKVDKRKLRIASMEPGEVLRLTYSVEIPTVGGSGQRIWTNTVTATDENGITDNDSCRVYVEPKPPKRLKIRKVGDRTTVKAGDIVTYTVTVKNNGLQNLVGVNITDDLAGIPAGNVVEFKLDTSSTVDQSPGNVTIKADKTGANIKEFQKDKIARFIYKIKIPDDAIENQTFRNSVQAVDTDGTMASDSWIVTKEVEVVRSSKLTVEKTVNDKTPEAGDVVTYVLSVKNSGETDLANVDINDVMPGIDPANFIDFKLDPSSTVGQDVGNVSIKPDKRGANIVSFKQGEEAKFTYRVKIPDDSPAGEVWTNTATATAADGTTANDTCSVTVHEEDYEVTSFTVTKTVDKPEVEAGDIVTYTLIVYNDGHLSNVNNLEINDVMPGIPAANFIDFKLDPSSTVDQAPGNVTINPSQRSAKIVSLEVGKEAKFTYRVKIPDDSPAGKVWTNTATATAADGTTANDNCSVTVKAMTDKIVIDKTVDKNKAKKNETVKYTIAVKNISSEILNNVKVSDSLNVTLVQKTSNSTVVISGNTATIGTLNPNETVIFEYDYTVPASAVIGSKIENTAKAIDPKNKEYIAKKEVEVVGTPKLAIKKTVDKPIVEAGDIVTYTLSVKNSGEIDLASVVIDDNMAAIPAANVMSFALDPSSTVDQTAGNVSIKADKTGANVVSLKKGKEARFTYRVKIPDDSPAGKVWINTATATAADGTTANDNCSVTVKAMTDKIVIDKTVDKNKAKKNETVKYTIAVKNISSEILNNVKVSDSLNVTLVQKTSNSTVVISGNTATIGTLNPNETVIFEYDYTVPASAVIGSKIENTAKAIDPKNKEYIAKKEVIVDGNTPPGPGPGPGPGPNPKPDPKPTPKDETLLDKMKKHEHFAYMTGHPDRTFKPEGKMSREEVTVMFARLLTAKMVLDTKHDAGFYDVLPTKWSKDQIGYMREKGIVKGYLDGSFKPNQPVTKAEFAAMASRFDNLSDGGNMKFSDVDSNYWAAKYIYSAAKKGWVKGYEDGTFRPDRFITRAEVVAATNRMLDRIADKNYVDTHQKQIKYYKDLNKEYWAYYTIHEASNGHDYKRNAEGGEIWLKLWDLFIPNP